MKFGFRKPNLKKMVRARTTGKIKRKMKSTINPFYGKKGVGFIKNPIKSIKNSLYHKFTFGLHDIFKTKKKNTKTALTKTVKTNTVQTTVTLEDVDKMNSAEKNKLYDSISEQYSAFYEKYYGNMQSVEKYYSLFINNNLDIKYFEKILECCNYIFENVEQFKNLELMNNKLTGSTDIVLQNNAFITLAKAYEKLEKYEEAITICQNAIDNGYTDDGTKNGMSGRIEKLKKKIK